MNALALKGPPITRAKRVCERARARSARFPPIVRAYRLREWRRAKRADRKKIIFRKTQNSGRRKGWARVRTLDPRATVASYISATGDDAQVTPLEGCARGFRI